MALKPTDNSINSNDDTEDKTLVNIPLQANGSRMKLVRHVFDHMNLNHSGLLAGKTGIGKTTFVKELSRLLGMPVLIVEAPHIIEEHIVNIPFVVFDPKSGTHPGQVKVDTSKGPKVQMAKSYLVKQLEQLRPINDNEYIKSINQSGSSIKDMFMSLGGDSNKIPDDIAELRSKYFGLFFIDEYFRKVPSGVRNLLRTILDNHIGNTKIPDGIYTMYASNMSDTGDAVEDMPLNSTMQMPTFKAPSKNEWFRYFIGKYQKKYNLNPIVINSFYNGLDDKDLAFDDFDSGIRTSPRRWEQLILYINSCIPVKDDKEAQTLFANIRSNFQTEQGTSSLYRKVDGIVRTIIKKTGGNSSAKALPATEWRDTLRHQISMKMKLGNDRTYVPLVMGQPGIGKTAVMAEIANDLNLRLISINCASLNAEDIIGVTLPDESNGELNVGFSEPPLYKLIENIKEKSTSEFMKNADQNRIKQWNQQKDKYLIFFDEFSRVKNHSVFNALRQIILEKKFNEHYSLPMGSIVVAAMNPSDHGAIELTGHMKDAMDMIDTAPSWSQLQNFLNNSKSSDPKIAGKSNEAIGIAEKLIESFVETFSTKVAPPEHPHASPDSYAFYIKTGSDSGEDVMYVQPREYVQLFNELVVGINRVIKTLDPDDQEAAIRYISDLVFDKFEHAFNSILRKYKLDPEDQNAGAPFIDGLRRWVSEIAPTLLTKKHKGTSLGSILWTVLGDHSKRLENNASFVSYISHFEDNDFRDQFTIFLVELINKELEPWHALMRDTHPDKKKVVATQKKAVDNFTSKLQYLVNEFRLCIKGMGLNTNFTQALDDCNHEAMMKMLENPDPNDKSKGPLSDELFMDFLERANDIYSGSKVTQETES